MSRSEKRKIFKCNELDIWEILSEYLVVENGFNTFQSSTLLLGTPGKDVRLIRFSKWSIFITKIPI